jgi:mRNA interferase RelE/StbE
MLGRFLDDPAGLGEAMAAVDALAEDPFPEGSVPYGKSHRRLHVGVYRATYEVTQETVVVINMARVL